MKNLLISICLLISTSFLQAEVLDASPYGFTVQHQQVVRASSAKVYQQIVQWSEWWSGEHSYSGDAGNFYLEPQANGCWCELLPDGGSVMHLMVVYAAPGKMLRLTGGLGPLQGMGVSGGLTISLEEKAGQTTITMTYTVGGYYKEGLDKLADPVDAVIGEQMVSLAGKFQ